jgi:DNA-binding beta-propeller fold protein YncE
VAVDAMGRVYVSDAIQSAVQIFDAHGKFVRRLGYEGGLLETGLKFNNPSALATDHAGRIYACDTKNCRIVVFDLQGEVILAFGRPLVVVSVSEPHGMIGFNYPRGLALDEKEKLLYVADTGNHRLRLFDTAGQPVQTFGSRGEQPGEFMLPIGLAVGRSGRLYVADSENYRVQVFDRGFKFSHSFGRRGASPGEFHHQPVAVAVSPEDDVIVCDGTDRMKVFSHDGRYAGGVSGRKLATAVPKYSAAALYGMDNLFAIDENGCQWHHFVYTEITE